MSRQRFQALGPLLGRGHIAMCRPSKCSVEMVFGQLKLSRRRPKQRRSFRCGSDGRCVVAGVDACLQLANPVPARANGQLGIALQMLLETALVKLRIIEGGKVRRQSAKHPDEPELPGDAVAGETEPHLPREFEPILGFLLDFTERISGGEKIS